MVEILMQIKCIGCKTLIDFDNPNRRLCSNCKTLRLKERNKQTNRKKFYKRNKTKGNCVICNSEFLGMTRKRIVCGQKCRIIHRRIILRSRKNFTTIKVNLFKSWVMWGEK